MLRELIMTKAAHNSPPPAATRSTGSRRRTSKPSDVPSSTQPSAPSSQSSPKRMVPPSPKHMRLSVQPGEGVSTPRKPVTPQGTIGFRGLTGVASAASPTGYDVARPPIGVALSPYRHPLRRMPIA